MAINVLGVKYPYSETGKWTKDEVESIDPDKVVLSNNAKKIIEKQFKNIKESNKILTELKSTDLEIAKLMAKRNWLVSDLRTLSFSAVSDVFKYTVNSASKISDSFEKHGFYSTIAKNAVQKVRSVLFDDTNEKFQQIVCTKILFGHDNELMFYFEHEPSGKCFRIDIPVCSEIDSHYLKHNTDIGPVFGIGLVYPWSPNIETTISYNYDVRVVKEQLKLFIDRDLEPIVGERDTYITSRYYNNENIMSMQDYQMEGDI